MIYGLHRVSFALFLRINHSGTLYSQRDTGFSGFVGRDSYLNMPLIFEFLLLYEIIHIINEESSVKKNLIIPKA